MRGGCDVVRDEEKLPEEVILGLGSAGRMAGQGMRQRGRVKSKCFMHTLN